MKTGLRFNICDLPSSFIRNEDVPGLSNRIKVRIPQYLRYACVQWAHHLAEVPHSSPELFQMLSDFAYNRLLFWFEMLGLTKTFGRVAPRALFDASRWSEVSLVIHRVWGIKS